MGISRRGFLVAAAGTTASIALASSGSRWPALLTGRTSPTDAPAGLAGDVGRATFEPLVGTRFRLWPESGPPVAVVLASVDDLSRRGTTEDGGTGPFSLLFTGPPAGVRPEQGTYTVDHPSLGSLRLFTVPVGLGRVAQDYEVIVNSRSVRSEAQ